MKRGRSNIEASIEASIFNPGLLEFIGAMRQQGRALTQEKLFHPPPSPKLYTLFLNGIIKLISREQRQMLLFSLISQKSKKNIEKN